MGQSHRSAVLAAREAPWPGRLFYASTHFGPTNSFWHDLPAMNAYVSRVQSFLQWGEPDADLLLYFPIHDLWHDPEGLQAPASVHHPERWLYGRPFHRVAQELDAAGYAVDYVSDRQLQALEWRDERLVAPEGRYRAILIPPTQLIPLPTLQRLVDLVDRGAVVLVVDALPSDVPGLGALAEPRQRLKELRARLTLGARVFVGPDPLPMPRPLMEGRTATLSMRSPSWVAASTTTPTTFSPRTATCTWQCRSTSM